MGASRCCRAPRPLIQAESLHGNGGASHTIDALRGRDDYPRGAKRMNAQDRWLAQDRGEAPSPE